LIFLKKRIKNDLAELIFAPLAAFCLVRLGHALKAYPLRGRWRRSRRMRWKNQIYCIINASAEVTPHHSLRAASLPQGEAFYSGRSVLSRNKILRERKNLTYAVTGAQYDRFVALMLLYWLYAYFFSAEEIGKRRPLEGKNELRSFRRFRFRMSEAHFPPI